MQDHTEHRAQANAEASDPSVTRSEQTDELRLIEELRDKIASRRKTPFRKMEKRYELLASSIAFYFTSSIGFIVALLFLLVALVIGVATEFTSRWFSIMSTVGSLTTLYMVFSLERATSKNNRAQQIKLDAILAALAGNHPKIVKIEDLSLNELKDLKEEYERRLKEEQPS